MIRMVAGASLICLAAAALAGCGSQQASAATSVFTGADAERGAEVIRDRDCGSCHVIPGIRGADGLVGPPLNSMARRTYIAGRVPNQPDIMVRWLMTPEAVDSMTAMPNLGLSEQQARDVAAYLYTLH